MNILRINKLLRLRWAILLLTEQQAAARRHVLKPLTDGDQLDLSGIGEQALEALAGNDTDTLALYEATDHVEFKVGEVIGLVGEIDKATLAKVDILSAQDHDDVEDGAEDGSEDGAEDGSEDGAEDGSEDGAEDDDQAGEDLADERLAELTEAIALLDEDNPQHWTQSNLPEVSALKDITGSKVTAAERDAAWEQYKQDNAGE